MENLMTLDLDNTLMFDNLPISTMIDVGLVTFGAPAMKSTEKKPVSHGRLIHIGTDDVRKRMGEILDCVNLRGNEFLIERKNKPLAVIIPVRKYELIQQMATDFLTKTMLAAGCSDLTDDEAMELANEAKHATRENKD